MAQDAIINRWNINGDVYDIQDAGRGRPLGVATLDENGRVPYTQLPESAVEFKGYWNASTNTPTLHDGTGTKGDMYYVDVAGTQDLGSGSQVFEVGDRVLYDGSVWKNMKSGGSDIEVYPTIADAEADLANLEEGQFVATEDGQLFSTTDTVESDNMNPVTSDAVYNAIKNSFPDYSQKELIFNSTSSNYSNQNYVMPEDGMLIASGYGQSAGYSMIYFEINGLKMYQQGYGDEYICNSVFAKKGTTVKISMALRTVNNGLYFVPCK